MSASSGSWFTLLASISVFWALPAAALPISPARQCRVLGGTEVPLLVQHRKLALCKIGRGEMAVTTLYEATILHRCGLAVQRFLTPVPLDVPANSGANPASDYCVGVGGTALVARLATGDELGLCWFADNSVLEEWTLFRGAAAAPELRDVLVAGGASCDVASHH